MTLVHLHLLLNHVPVIGSVFAALILLVAISKRSSEVGKLGLAALVIVGAVAAIVFLSGEPAEDAVEAIAGISEAAIKQHEEIAEAALVASGIAGAFALLALWWNRRRELPRWLAGTAFVASLAVVGLMGWTANLGGQIRHTEIRTASAATEGHEAGAASDERDADERGRRR